MGKINITKKTGGVETLNLISAFSVEGNTYVVLDNEKIGSTGLPVIFLSKYTNKLEKIIDPNEWQSLKNYLKGIINGTVFQYLTLPENVNADEEYYTQLSLPNQTTLDAIKTKYAPSVNIMDTLDTPKENVEVPNSPVVQPQTVMPEVPQVQEVAPTSPAPSMNMEPPKVEAPAQVMPVAPEVVQPAPTPSVEPAPQVPVMPEPAPAVVPAMENTVPAPTPNVVAEPPKVEAPTNVAPPVEAPATSVAQPQVVNEVTPNVVPTTPIMPKETPMVESVTTPVKEVVSTSKRDFSNDKETFLKACENMFDALISKYEKELSSLEARELELARKEQEIENKLKAATEHLENAKAKEQVANIAHDNAQKVMDINSMLPNNPTNATTGVL